MLADTFAVGAITTGSGWCLPSKLAAANTPAAGNHSFTPAPGLPPFRSAANTTLHADSGTQTVTITVNDTAPVAKRRRLHLHRHRRRQLHHPVLHLR